MKNSAKLFMCLTLFLAIGMSAYGQNVQKEVENMYERRAQKAEAERLAAEKERLVAEQIQAQIRKQEEERQARLQQEWERALGEGAKHFDRKRVEETVRPFVNLNEVLDSIPLGITDPKAVLSKGSPGIDSSLAGAPQTRFSQTKIPQPQNYREIRFLPESMYNIAYKVHREVQGVKKLVIWDGFEKRKIHKGPLLLVKRPDGDCVAVDLGYNKFEVKCEDYPYMPKVEERKKALRDLGFSENTVQKYAVKNPWNLETFVACDKFKEKSTFLVPTKQPNEYVRHGDLNLVEKVVVAWRYATFTDEKTNKNQKQYRYVFIQKDGQEREEKPQTDWEIPQCLDIDGKSRESSYKSITQSKPPEQNWVMTKERRVWTYFGGDTEELAPAQYQRAHETLMMSADEEWYF